MMRKRLSLFVAVLMALSLLLSACGNAAATNESAETTEGLPMNIMQKSDPAQDDTINVLMIGNSFCYYYVEELYGMAKAAGIKMRVCNVYYSGCKVEQHWTWWKNGESNYSYFTTDENGRKEVKNTNLEYCLSQQNWDVISLQDASTVLLKNNITPQEQLTKMTTCLDDLWGYIKRQFPMSRHLWQACWSYQIGYDRGGYAMKDPQTQAKMCELGQEYGDLVCKAYNLEKVNTGDAWQLVRQDGYDNLCARTSVNNGGGDYYHDGDIGGGQYLNACVWFEVITGQSGVGNTYRPDYALDTDITYEKLQEAAHQAVQNRKVN